METRLALGYFLLLSLSVLALVSSAEEQSRSMHEGTEEESILDWSKRRHTNSLDKILSGWNTMHDEECKRRRSGFRLDLDKQNGKSNRLEGASRTGFVKRPYRSDLG